MNYLVEKKQYTYLLTNSLSYTNFKGLKSIYNVSQENSNKSDVLKNFQTFLGDIKMVEDKIKEATEDTLNEII